MPGRVPLYTRRGLNIGVPDRMYGIIPFVLPGMRPVSCARFRGRPGFDVGCEAAQGMPRTSDLVNPSGNFIYANDERFALAA
jgi:hypothetical protein